MSRFEVGDKVKVVFTGEVMGVTDTYTGTSYRVRNPEHSDNEVWYFPDELEHAVTKEQMIAEFKKAVKAQAPDAGSSSTLEEYVSNGYLWYANRENAYRITLLTMIYVLENDISLSDLLEIKTT